MELKTRCIEIAGITANPDTLSADVEIRSIRTDG